MDVMVMKVDVLLINMVADADFRSVVDSVANRQQAGFFSDPCRFGRTSTSVQRVTRTLIAMAWTVALEEKERQLDSPAARSTTYACRCHRPRCGDETSGSQ